MNKIVYFENLKAYFGFTLAELMITVGIAGILVSVAIPNFMKYQAKSKTLEAKMQLAAAYTQGDCMKLSKNYLL